MVTLEQLMHFLLLFSRHSPLLQCNLSLSHIVIVTNRFILWLCHLCPHWYIRIGSVFLYTGQGKFHDGTKHTLDYVVQQARSTVDGLRNVSNTLAVAKHTGVSQIFIPQNVQNNIDKVDAKINSAAETLENETEKNKKDIMIILDFV